MRIHPIQFDFIVGRCVTTNSLVVGRVIEVIRSNTFESTWRYRIQDECGREYIVFHQGFVTSVLHSG